MVAEVQESRIGTFGFCLVLLVNKSHDQAQGQEGKYYYCPQLKGRAKLQGMCTMKG